MCRKQDGDTRYFIDIDVASMEIVACGFDQKQNLNGGRQTTLGVYRLFLTKGQYNKFTSACASEWQPVIER
ncbi:Uncharacterised protein [BD1-7 clade bacterium]|uniref:Uncharacterized protein n=1 Tax=BD1-7 clade bacterium TaxID=2029982 RepID=A0A5S9PHJ3_9GAMM|nr:Uncharacterised protein [BD1-7 clade bacterium]